MTTSIKRQYTDLAGVDFKNDESLVNLNRSPDALNVYKDYTSEGNCIQTRPGYSELAEFDGKINGMYMYSDTVALVHAGTKLYLWNNFPSTPQSPTVLSSSMANVRSTFFIFDNKLYINDGTNYLVYDGTLKTVASIAYVPTTSINRAPSGGGVQYQDVNLMQPQRINTFVGDGTSVDYYVDAETITSVDAVYVNDVATTDYTVTLSQGKITFTTAPAAPGLQGVDNVKIVFSKTITGYSTRIPNCTISQVFDNRVFFTGNPSYPNVLWHSELENPTYIADVSYYEDGTSESKIKSATVGNNILWVFKEPNQENATVFYHIPTTSSQFGRIYPTKQGNVSTGCYSTSINFNDDIVFLSKYGLEGITGDIEQEQLLSHRSSLVDNKMINTSNFNASQMVEWQGYLLVLADRYVFLADSRQKFQGINGIEYEWYLWDIFDGLNAEESETAVLPNILKEYKGNLYIGSTDGKIYKFTGTNDNGVAIVSYWTTPMDAFGYSNMLKTTNKRGGVARIKTIPNGKIKVAERTNKTNEKLITTKAATGFDFTDVDFSNFAFTTKNDSYIVYKIKEKKFLTISLKFYSDELDKPFGLYSSIIEAFVGGYVKR